MRIFKNRGDIYFSKTDKEKSSEQKFLLFALIFIVVFTVIFVFVVGAKNDFSAKKFFAPDNPEVTNLTEEEMPLPDVEGRSNFIFLLHHKDKLLFTALIQADMDNTSYKVSCLKSATEADSKTLEQIYKDSGAQNVKNAVESLLNADFDYYISMEFGDFVDFYNKLGPVHYPVVENIRHRDTLSEYGYNLKIKAGEQTIKGADAANLIRFYLDEKNNASAAGDVILFSLSQQINEENYTKREELFKDFVTLCETDITVRDLSAADDKLLVLSNEKTGVRTYNAAAEYKNNEIKNKKEVKGYFVK